MATLQWLTPEDWQTLTKKYPHLEGDIAVLSHPRELAFTRRELAGNLITPERRRWLETRLADLTFFDNLTVPKE